MAKQIFYDEDARHRILKGAEALYEAVRTTMGPKGHNVVIGKNYGGPTVTHDGVTVAKAVELEDDNPENYGYKIGAELIKEAASKMNDMAGDGTTTVTVLTYSILKEAHKVIAAGHNPVHLRQELEAAAQKVVQYLKSQAEDIGAKKEKVAQVATISAGNPEIGNLIAEVMDKVGKDGVVTVEEGQGLTLESEVVEGFTFERGFISPYMVTDATRLEAVYDKPFILVTDKKISSVKEILPIIEKLATSGQKHLVMVAEDVDGEALGVLVLNKLKGVFNTVAVKAPGFGDRQKQTLEDIAILTGATLISSDQGQSLENMELDMLGQARRVIVSKDETTLIEGSGSSEAVSSRIKQIQSQAQIASSDYDKEDYLKRAAALNGKVAVIKVGGATETEIEEKKFRVDDAVAAVKAALNEGIVAGGGVSLVNAARSLNTKKDQVGSGISILINALEQPLRVLFNNAGLNPDEWLPQINSASEGYGLDVNRPEELIDMKKEGIIDPLQVAREAVQNAVSIAGTAMTMGALIVDIPAKEASSGPAMDPSAMGM